MTDQKRGDNITGTSYKKRLSATERKTMSKKYILIMSFLLFLTFQSSVVFGGGRKAEFEEIYTAPANKLTKPGGAGWTKAKNRKVTLDPGTTISIGVKNDPNKVKQKTLDIRFTEGVQNFNSPINQCLRVTDVDGFYSDGSTVNVYLCKGYPLEPDDPWAKHYKYVFGPPQPAYEVFQVKNTCSKVKLEFEVQVPPANCTQASPTVIPNRPPWSKPGTIKIESIMGYRGTEATIEVDKIGFWHNVNTVDNNYPPEFNAPEVNDPCIPSDPCDPNSPTGTWDRTFITVDPNTEESLPQGGWLLSCQQSDRGIWEAETFGLSMTTTTLAGGTYWLVVHDRIRDEWFRFPIEYSVACDPHPRNNDILYPLSQGLSWLSGDNAEPNTSGHEVYFGTDYYDVNNAGASDPEYRGSTNVVGPDANGRFSYDAGLYENLVTDQTYYWRVDEVNQAGPPPCLWKGDVWRFKAANYITIDDFELYGSTEDMNVMWNTTIFPAGSSGYCNGISYVGTGAVLNLDGFNQTMLFDYNNNSPTLNLFSEARLESNSTGVDWTAGNSRVLSISYIGQANNSADPTYDRMYAAIRDAAGNMGPVVYNPDAAAQQRTTWQNWLIKLSDLNSPNVDLTQEVNLIIGFGQRCNEIKAFGGVPGGIGTVTFDNIRLYPAICNPPYGPAADFSGDCFVDITDLDLFVNDWLLRTEVNTFPGASAPPVAPILWYQFEETDGNIVYNSGTRGAGGDGTVVKSNASTWDADGHIGRCINLPYGSNSFVNVPSGILADYAGTTKTAFTITCWINWDANHPMTEGWEGLIDAYYIGIDNNDEVLEVECPTPKPPIFDYGPKARFRVGWQADVMTDKMREGDFGRRWNHYAFVVDADTNVASIYENGSLIGTSTTLIDSPLFSGAPQIFHIGARWGETWGTWAGKIDDFRFYDYALDANQIAWIATNGTKTITVPLVERTNLKTGETTEVVNLRDFAVLANQWMQEQLWP